jgi:hypothetical protein
METLKSKGKGKKAEPLSSEEIQSLQEKGMLGTDKMLKLLMNHMKYD